MSNKYSEAPNVSFQQSQITSMAYMEPFDLWVLMNAINDFLFDDEATPTFEEIENARSRRRCRQLYEQFVATTTKGFKSYNKRRDDGSSNGHKRWLKDKYVKGGLGDEKAFNKMWDEFGGDVEKVKAKINELLNNKNSKQNTGCETSTTSGYDYE